MNLKNKKVIITGATGGIGNSLVKKFNDNGSIILATGTKEEKLNNLKNKFSNIHIEKFNLDEHKNIESFIESASNKIDSTDFQKPIIDIICNVTSKSENNPENIKKLLVEQICSTVRWRESIINMSKENVNNFIEIGPGKVLSGMVKRTVKNINSFSINSIDDMKKTIDESKK